MVKVTIKSPEIYDQNKNDFQFIGGFQKLIDLAIRKAERGGSPQARIMSDAEYFLTPGYYYDFGQDNPLVSIDVYIDEDVYLDIVDESDYTADQISQIISSITPQKIRCQINVSLFPFSLLSPPGVEPWRSNPQYHFRDGVEAISQEVVERIWGSASTLHVFISHKAEQKTRAHNLKAKLSAYGISSFVAHDDIEPAEEWQTAIEKALFSSDALIALICDKFSMSQWTDQEVGIAIGRQIPVFPVKLGDSSNPYGFIGKIQAFKVKEDIIELFVSKFANDSRTSHATISSLLYALGKEKADQSIASIINILSSVQTSLWKPSHKTAYAEVYGSNKKIKSLGNAADLYEALGLKPSATPPTNWAPPIEDDIPF